MKLADAQTDSGRQRLRESHLDDLENALKEETPSYDDESKQGSDALTTPFPNETKKGNTHQSNIPSSTPIGLGAGTGVGNRHSRILDPFEDTSDTTPLSFTATNTKMNADSERQELTADDPFSSVQYNTDGGEVGDSSRNPSSLRRTSISGYGPVNPPPDQYDYDYYSYSRKCKIVTLVILLAIIGLTIGLLAPGTGRPGTKLSPNNNTSPTTNSPDPDFDTVFDELFVKAVDVLNNVMVSAPFRLSKACHQKICGGDGNLDRLDIRDRVMHYLVFNDELFRGWVFANDFDNVERVIQRYVITLFAFSTGLEKSAVDGDNEFTVNTWLRYENWLDGKDECNWYGITCDQRSAYVNVKDFVDHTKLVKTAIARDLPNRPVENIPMVVEIRLNQNKLEGDLIPELFKLRHLERLELWKAELRGRIDPSIKLLTALKKLWLHENKFLEGSLPAEIGSLSNLESLFVGGNKLTGALPDMSKWKNLKTLAVQGNGIGGIIPKSIENTLMLERLFLDDNKFSGSLPVELGFLEKLTDVRVNMNELTGTLPLQLGKLNNLEVLYLHNNKFDGRLSDILLIGWPSMSEYFFVTVKAHFHSFVFLIISIALQ